MDQTLMDNHKEKVKLVESVTNHILVMGFVFSLSFFSYKIVCVSLIIYLFFKIYTHVVVKKYSFLKHKILIFILYNFLIFIFCISSANVIGKTTIIFDYNFLNILKIILVEIIILISLYAVLISLYLYAKKNGKLKINGESELNNTKTIITSMTFLGLALGKGWARDLHPNSNEMAFVFGLCVFSLAMMYTYTSSIVFIELKEYFQKQLEKQS